MALLLETGKSGQLSRAQRWFYAWPTFARGIPHFLFQLYFFRFSTDELQLDPAIVGALLAVSRVWDAISDVAIAALSDRRWTRYGRRRPWIAAGSLVLAASVAALWSAGAAPPGTARIAWVGAAMLFYFTGYTAVVVPHGALGVELSRDDERHRLFAARHVAYTLAMVIGVGVITAFTELEDTTLVARCVAWGGAALVLIGGFSFVFFLREERPAKAPDKESLWAGLPRVIRSADARWLLMVAFLEQSGTAALSALGPFIAAVLIGDESSLPFLLVAYVGSLLLAAPWVAKVARHVGTHRLWRSGMVVSAVGYASLALIPRGGIIPLMLSSAVIGAAGAVSAVLDRSMLAAVIDRVARSDEAVFFGARTFVEKSAYAASVFVAGLALSGAGYEAGAIDDEVASTLRVLIAGVPCTMMLLAAWAGGRVQEGRNDFQEAV